MLSQTTQDSSLSQLTVKPSRWLLLKQIPWFVFAAVLLLHAAIIWLLPFEWFSRSPVAMPAPIFVFLESAPNQEQPPPALDSSAQVLSPSEVQKNSLDAPLDPPVVPGLR